MASKTVELRQKARELRSRMRKLGQMIQGSITFRRITCGKSNCKCARGQLHTCVCITYKEKGRTKTVYVDKAAQGEALIMCANYKKMKVLLKQLSLTNMEVVKSKRSSDAGGKK